MTEPHDLDAARVAELQQQLNEAAAKMAAVQSELAQATGDSGGQPVVGQPVVSQGGSVDLTQYVGPQRAEQIREALGQLGLDSRITTMFGASPGLAGFAGPPTPTTVERLADPPRRVPFSFRMAAFSWSWWELFGIVMGFTGPIALWAFFPTLIPTGLIVGLAVIAYLRGRKAITQAGLLKWGKVATVTDHDELSRGTYYSGTTYRNMRVAQAHGWDVTRDWYSGPASKSKIDYTLDGATGSLVLRGLPYAGGVILANSRTPSSAQCVSQFPYAVKPDSNGEFVGRLPARMWLGIIATILIEGGLVAGAVASALYFWGSPL